MTVEISAFQIVPNCTVSDVLSGVAQGQLVCAAVAMSAGTQLAKDSIHHEMPRTRFDHSAEFCGDVSAQSSCFTF